MCQNKYSGKTPHRTERMREYALSLMGRKN